MLVVQLVESTEGSYGVAGSNPLGGFFPQKTTPALAFLGIFK